MSTKKAKTQKQRVSYRFVVQEIKQYQETKQLLANLEDEIVRHSVLADGMPRGNKTSDPTGDKSVQVMSSAAIAHSTRIIWAVESVMCRLESTPALMVRLYFWVGRTEAVVINGLYQGSQSTFYRHRRAFISSVAYNLGIDIGE